MFSLNNWVVQSSITVQSYDDAVAVIADAYKEDEFLICYDPIAKVWWVDVWDRGTLYPNGFSIEQDAPQFPIAQGQYQIHKE